MSLSEKMPGWDGYNSLKLQYKGIKRPFSQDKKKKKKRARERKEQKRKKPNKEGMEAAEGEKGEVKNSDMKSIRI